MAEPKGRRVTYRVTNKRQFARAKSALDNAPANKARRTITRREAVRKIRDGKVAVTRKLQIKKIVSKKRMISSGVTAVTAGTKKLSSVGKQPVSETVQDDVSSYYEPHYSRMSSAPASAVDTYDMGSEIANKISERRRKIIKEKSVEKIVSKSKAGKAVVKTDKVIKNISNSGNVESSRRISDSEVKRWRASQKAKTSAEEWRRQAAKNRAIANIQARKAREADDIFRAFKYGSKAVKAAGKSKLAALIAKVAAGVGAILPVILVILAIFLICTIILETFFFYLPAFRGWYSGEMAPASNLGEAITEMTNLYARDVRTYCHYNNVPMPSDCSPEWGRTLALWSVLAQHYMGDQGLMNRGGLLNFPQCGRTTITYRSFGLGVRSMDVPNYSGVLLLSEYDDVNQNMELQPGLYELLYFCFRVIHYDMIGVTEDESNNYEVVRDEVWGAPTIAGMFSRGLPRLRTEEFDPITTEVPIYEELHGTGYELGAGGSFPECSFCHPSSSLPAPQQASMLSTPHYHTVQTGTTTHTMRHIVTTIQPLTAFEALDLIHDVSAGRYVSINDEYYMPSNQVKNYCVDIMTKRFSTSLGTLAVGNMTGAGFAELGGCGANGTNAAHECYRQSNIGCLYDQYYYMLSYYWGQNNQGWYYRTNGEWVWSSTKPDNIYTIGVMPDLTASFGPLWITSAGYDSQGVINLVCDALWSATGMGDIRSVWIEHLRYLAVNCVAYDLQSSSLDPYYVSLFESIGVNAEDYVSYGTILWNGRIQDGTSGSAAFRTVTYYEATASGDGFTEAIDWCGSDSYTYASAFQDAIFDVTGDSWIAQGYEGPRSSRIVNYGPGDPWCAWFVCYAANTNGLFQCYERGTQYSSYYNLLAHTSNEIDTGEGYFCNDEAVSPLCQEMLLAFYNHSLEDGEVSVELHAENTPFLGIEAGDILFMNPNGDDHRSYRTASNGDILPKTNHVGIVLGVTETQVIYLDGNSGANCDRINIGVRNLDDNYLVAYADMFATQHFDG